MLTAKFGRLEGQLRVSCLILVVCSRIQCPLPPRLRPSSGSWRGSCCLVQGQNRALFCCWQ